MKCRVGEGSNRALCKCRGLTLCELWGVHVCGRVKGRFAIGYFLQCVDQDLAFRQNHKTWGLFCSTIQILGSVKRADVGVGGQWSAENATQLIMPGGVPAANRNTANRPTQYLHRSSNHWPMG